MAALMAAVPSACAGRAAKAPLKLPTGVRAAEAMTISVMTGTLPSCREAAEGGPGPAPATSAAGASMLPSDSPPPPAAPDDRTDHALLIHVKIGRASCRE